MTRLVAALPACHTPVSSDDPIGIDLYPGWMDVSLPDASFEKLAAHWTAQFARTKDIWLNIHV